MPVNEHPPTWQPSWFHRRCPALLTGLSWPYRMAVELRTWCYERRWFGVRRLPKPVISIGNLTVGGTGKTPIVMWLARRLQRNGVRVAILSRGYGRNSHEPHVLVSDGHDVVADPDRVGDEPYLMAVRSPGVIVAVGRDRYRVGQWVLQHHDVECFVLDDGYQHLRLHRDLNVVLLDLTDAHGVKALLPRGRLREPVSALKRADAVIFTRADQAADHEPIALWERYGEAGAVQLCVRFVPTTLTQMGGRETQEVAWLNGRSVALVSGIGNAGAFRRMVEEAGAEIVNDLAFPDHHRYTFEDAQQIRRQRDRAAASLVLTTEKDAVKLESHVSAGDNIWSVGLTVECVEGFEAFEARVRDVVTRVSGAS